MTAIEIRSAKREDAAALQQLSVVSIGISAAGYYTPGQLGAWAHRRSVDGHRRMIERTTVFVALEVGRLAGFASVALQASDGLHVGEVDQLFVHPQHGGRGIARLLLTRIEQVAREAAVTELVTHASWRAVPVFERLGYQREATEEVRLDEEILARCRMRNRLQV